MKGPFRILIFLLVVVSTLGLMTTKYYYLAFLPGAGLLFAVYMIARPTQVFYLVILLIPFGAYRKVGGINVPWVLGAMLMALVIIQYAIGMRDPRTLASNFWRPLLLFFFIYLVSAFISPYTETSAEQLVLFVASVLFIFVTLSLTHEQGLLREIPALLVGSVSVSATLAVLGYAFRLSWFASKTYEGGFTRGAGGSEHPLNLSMMIIFVLPLLIHGLIYGRSMPYRFLYLCLIILNLAGLVVTFSRGGFLLLLVMIPLIMWQYFRRFSVRGFAYAMLGGLMALGILASLVPDSYWERQQSLSQGKEQSLGRRYSYLVVGFRAFLQYPVIGSGPGTFLEHYSRSDEAQVHRDSSGDLERHAHNTYLEVLVGTGLLGIVTFLFVLWRCFDNFSRAGRALLAQGEQKWGDLMLSYRLSFVSLLAYLAIATNPFHKYMLLAFGLSQVALRVAQGRRQDTPPPLPHPWLNGERSPR